MSQYFDAFETESGDVRESRLFGALARFLPDVVAGAPGWARHLEAVDVASVTSRETLAKLPILRKSDLNDLQVQAPPFGGFTIGGPEDFGRIFMSPGPILEPMGSGSDPWRGARAFHAAGFRPGEILHNSFSYHLTPGGFAMDSAARALGLAVMPAGTGNSDMQVEAISLIRPAGFAGTPDYLKVLLDRADELGSDVSSINKALVSGGALFASLRDEYASRGVQVRQCYATADVGVVAYESEAMEGLILDEGVIVEIVRPGTGEPVPDGDVGEVVVTTLNPVYPMIRFGTGDLSAIMAGQSPCGRTNQRIKGWMGRADQTTKVKGMFIHPSQVAEIGHRHPELDKLRLVVARNGEQDAMTLMAESVECSGEFTAAIALSIQTVCKVRGDVKLVAAGELPNDGKVISDEREY